MLSSLRSLLYRFLRWSERYTKTDMVYLGRGGFWSLFGQFFASLIAFALALAMARFVPKEVYGQYKYMLAIISLLGTFSLNGLGGAVLQSAARGYRAALLDGFNANLRWSLVVFLGAFGFGGYYLIQGNAVLGLGILIGGCATPFFAGFNLYGPFLSGLKDFRRLAWYSDVVTNAVPALALILVAYLDPRPLTLLITYFVANLAAAGYVFVRSARRYGRDAAHDAGMVSYGKHLSAMGIANGIANNIDQLLLFHFVGPVELAIYNFATAIPDQTKGPLKMLDGMLQARLAVRSEESIAPGMLQKYLWLFAGGFTMFVVYALAAPFIFHILFPVYAVAIPYSQVYALSFLALTFAPAGSYLAAKKKIGPQYRLSFANSAVTIAFISVGVIWYGLWGLIVARVAIRMVNASLPFLFYRPQRTTTATGVS